MLVAEGLAAFRGERLVLSDVSFSLPPGGATLLVGPNGSGKSTLLRLLAGLGRIEAGSLRWNGEDCARDPSTLGARCAYLGHQDAIKPGLTTAENLRLAAARASAGATIETALEAVALTPLTEMPARVLSAGQRRRLALARLLLSPATLWLLDEPTLGLDTASVTRLGTVLAAHRARGGMVVAATHLPLPLPNASTLELQK